MRFTVVTGLFCLLSLSACVGNVGANAGDDNDHVTACQEQSDWASNGKVPAGDIAISCPEHGIGPYGASVEMTMGQTQ